jgi:hypothetical protein
LFLFAIGSACRSEAPDEDDDGTACDWESGDDGAAEDCGTGEIPEIDESACEALESDYQPRDNASSDDDWPACITDDGEYHLVADAPSSIARVEAFETIADLLWRNGTPSMDDFTSARSAYSEAEGLESRLVRREDMHYPEIPEADWEEGVDPDKQCTVTENAEKYPDRCAGPGKIAPLVQEAFAAGQTCDGNPNVHAARIEAGLLWFLYLSPYKECFTCTLKGKDCDSCWAYYTGGYDRASGIGISGLVREISDQSHQAIFDGVSAVRCWRDLYPEADYPTWDDVPPEGQDLHALGWEQLDNALHRGLALVVRKKLEDYATVCGTSEATPIWAFLEVLGPVLDREATERNGAAAQALVGFWQDGEPTSIDEVVVAIDTLDTIFGCPQP